MGGLGGAPAPGDVVFRLLCPNARTGSVIGKGGEVIKQLREDTGARIKVEHAVPGRVGTFHNCYFVCCFHNNYFAVKTPTDDSQPSWSCPVTKLTPGSANPSPG
jgi:hypothetical protein